jgi:branched-chain amino acid transport system substrate-binding protein
MKLRISTLTTAALVGLGMASMQPANASPDSVKIGFITDMSGLYADVDGAGGVAAIKMAVKDFGGKVLGKPIEVVDADHQNKADVAASTARKWFDRDGVDMLIGGTNSSTGLAMNTVAAQKKRVYFNVGGATDALTGKECQPYGVHYGYDVVALARGTGSAIVKGGGKSWYFLTADYAFGHALEQATADAVKSQGGTVKGDVKHPLSASDFSSFLVQAQSSGAQVLGLANAGGDFDNAVKAADEFGVNKKMQMAGLLVFVNDIRSLGLKATQGMELTTSWYWDKDDASRAFAKRFFDTMHKMPSSLQAADYSATLTYLKAVQAAGTTDADKVMAELKSMKVHDMFADGYIRRDGLLMHDMYLMQVKTPAESHGPWDFYKLVSTIPANVAFTSLAQSACPLLKK